MGKELQVKLRRPERIALLEKMHAEPAATGVNGPLTRTRSGAGSDLTEASS
jgi:hypothetical protein